MESSDQKAWISQVRKGLVELCVMAALEENEAYGYELLQKLKVTQGLAITESTVYPILVRLEKEGRIQVRLASSPAGPPRRYYRLTGAGRERLALMKSYWAEIRESIDTLLKGEDR